MKLAVKLCILFAALIHFAFLVMQMFFWQSTLVQTRLLAGFTLEQKAEILAHNQGLYNGFLGAGLAWALLAISSNAPPIKVRWVAVFFLTCAIVVGIYGSMTLGRPTAFVLQSLPGLIALPLLWLNSRERQRSFASSDE